MALIIRNKVLMTFLPKTGSSWIEQSLKTMMPKKDVINIVSPGWCEKHLPMSMFNDRFFRIITVRQPVEWHRSWWSFNIDLTKRGINGWNVYKYLDHEDFQTHIDQVLEQFPNFYSSKIDQLTDRIDAVIRQENLNQELINALNEGLSESFKVEDLPKLKKILVTKPEDKALAVYRDDQPDKIREANASYIKQFYG